MVEHNKQTINRLPEAGCGDCSTTKSDELAEG
jgi:hypothetical protein